MYGLPSPHNSESSSVYIKEEDKNRCGCKLIYESLFRHNKEASNTRMNGRERERVQVTHASYTINVP